MIAGYSLMMNASSVFALFIGMFIIYNSFATAVSERRKEIGVLRALGASRAQVRLLFLLESAVAGLLGSLAGIIAGTFIARGIAASIGGLIHDVYGVARQAVHPTATPGLLAVSLAIGIGASMIAAWIPARAAAAVDPVRALQKGGDASLSSAETRARLVLAAVSALASTGCLLLDRSGALLYASYVLATLFALTPFLSGQVDAVAATAAEMGETGRRDAGCRQPDSGAAPDVRQRRRAHAVVRTRRGVCRYGTVYLRIARGLDEHDVES